MVRLLLVVSIDEFFVYQVEVFWWNDRLRLVLRDRTNGSGSLAGCCEPLESILKKENSLDSLGEW